MKNLLRSKSAAASTVALSACCMGLELGIANVVGADWSTSWRWVSSGQASSRTFTRCPGHCRRRSTASPCLDPPRSSMASLRLIVPTPCPLPSTPSCTCATPSTPFPTRRSCSSRSCRIFMLCRLSLGDSTAACMGSWTSSSDL